MNMPTVKETEEKIGIPATEWKGRCHEIANLLKTNFKIEGELRYGSWLGDVEKGSMFERYPIGYIHHGWIEMPNKTIVDPTRWEFEQKEPYIYVGENDYYDAGSNMQRFKNMKPAPKYSKEEKQVKLQIQNRKAFEFVADTLEAPLVGEILEKWTVQATVNQAFWLANLPLQVLGESAKPVYLALKETGYIALVPWDNRQMVLKDR